MFKRTTIWRHIIVDIAGPDFDQVAFATACRFADRFECPMYFSRYTGKEADRIEIKAGLGRTPNAAILAFFNVEPYRNLTINNWGRTGSEAHAKAFELARSLHGQGDREINDVVHWLMNMLGCNYLQEASLHVDAAHVALEIIKQFQMKK